MDRAQQAFTAGGLDVPSYVAFGNHDALVQGNAAANAAFEQVATGCLKPIGPVSNPENASALLASLFNPVTLLGLVPDQPAEHGRRPRRPEPPLRLQEAVQGHLQGRLAGRRPRLRPDRRRPGDRLQRRRRLLRLEPGAGDAVHRPRHRRRGGHDPHPDRQIDLRRQHRRPAVQMAARAAASGDRRRPAGGALQPPRAGEPGRRRPRRAGAALHAQRLARPRHQPRLRPRPAQLSFPIHLEADAVNLLHEYPNAIAWVAGHSHDNIVDAFPNPSGPGGFWSIRVAAEADWPQQTPPAGGLRQPRRHALDLRHDPRPRRPGGGAGAGHAGRRRWTSTTSPRRRGRCPSTTSSPARPLGEGQAEDRNVELLIDDPR